MKDTSQLAENKLIIIYMLYNMNLPVSLSYIQEFALSAEYMDYFTLSSYIVDLADNGYIIKNEEHNKTTYTVSENGKKVLELFENMIPEHIRENIDKYVKDNRNQVRKDVDIVATYKENDINDFSILCGTYEENVPLMEINIKVTSKKYAKMICRNWKKDAPKYYLNFLKSLLENNDDA